MANPLSVMDAEYKAVTKKFFELLKDSGCKTNYQASKKTGISQSTLSEVKRGISKLSIREALKACKAFDYEIRFVKIPS